MKLHLPKPLRAALAAAASAVTFATMATGSSTYAEGTYADEYGTDLGTVQFVGDSITHGSDLGGTHDAASWRWAIHKIFVDNGITYSENGYHVGNLSANAYVPVYPGGSTYGGVDWENRHSAQASGRAHELIAPNNTRYEGNTPDTLVQNYPSDKFFLLIGTNDTLSDYANRNGVGAEGNLTRFSSDLLGCTVNADSSYTFSGNGRMDTIVDTFHKNGDRTAGTADDAPVVVLSIPTWSPNHSNNNQAADFAAMVEYNKRMKAWSEQKEGVLYVEVNTGLVDVANTAKPGAGVNSMFNDNLHPSGQGDLIIAGNVAKSLGYAGRSVGLTRQDAAAWDHAAEALTLTSSSSAQTFATGLFDNTDGYTIDFNATFGDGNTANWLDASNALTITVGDGFRGGTLKMSEAYISWGDRILYSRDNSVATEDHLRIAFVNGSLRAEDNVTAGYYVWLGDMLIGEGLSYSSSSFNGISLGVDGSGTGSVSSLSWVDAAYAPTTTGALDASNAFVLEQGRIRNSYAATAKSLNIDFTNATSTSGQYATTGKAATGALLLKQNADPGTSWIGVVGTAHSGDISILYTEFTSSLNIFGAINGNLTAGAGTPGNLSIVLNQGVTLGAGTYDSCGNQSIIGTFDKSIAGAFQVEINDATLNGGIIMGVGHNNGAALSVGSTLLYVNDGATVNGNIYGGSYTNNTSRTTTIANGTAIHITGGRVNGSVYGGNKKNGTISGGTSVVISGGYITGSVYGGNETSGTINGGTQVTVEGNAAHIDGSITADTVTLKDVARNTEGYTDGFDCYAGTITATNLVLDNYTAGLVNAKLVTDNLTAANGTVATIHGLQLRNCSIDATGATALTLGESVISGNTISYSGNIRLEDGTSFTITNPTSLTRTGEGFTDGSYIYKVTDGQQGSLLAADGTALTEAHTATFTGTDYLEGASFSYDSATGALIAYSRRGNYNIISSTVDYSTINTASSITMSGGRLNLDTDLTSATTSITATGGIVYIADSVTLAQSSLTANGATILAGEGTYALASGSQTMPGNVTLSDDWTGIVKLTGAITDLNLGNAALGNAGSSIELADVTGRLKKGFNTDANIILSGSGLTLNNNGYSATYNFNGSISGSGDINRANDRHNWEATLNFKGDVSGWTGDIIMDRANSIALNVNFLDNAKVINTSLSVPNWNSIINLGITNSEKVTMNGSLETNENHDNSQMRVTIGSAQQATSVDFTNTVHADRLTLVGASTATFMNETTVRHALTAANGTIIVGGNAPASLTANDTASIGTLKMEGADATATFNGATIISAIQANGGHGNMLINGDTALTTGSLTIATDQQGTQLAFANHLTVTGGSYINVAYADTSQSGTSVTFNNGFSYTGSNAYALTVGRDAAVTLAGGDTNLENKTIGLAPGAVLTVANGATLTVGRMYNSSILGNNGTLTVEHGGSFTLEGGNAGNSITTLANSGTVTLSGNSLLTVDTMTAAADSSLTTGEGFNLTVTSTLDINAGATVASGGNVTSNILNLNGSLSVQGDLGVNTLNMSGGLLTASGNLTADGVTLGNNATLNIAGALSSPVLTLNSLSEDAISLGSVNGPLNFSVAESLITGLGLSQGDVFTLATLTDEAAADPTDVTINGASAVEVAGTGYKYRIVVENDQIVLRVSHSGNGWTGKGEWSTADNWSDGMPGETGTAGFFGEGSSEVAVSGDVTVGSILVDSMLVDGQPKNYTFTGDGSLQAGSLQVTKYGLTIDTTVEVTGQAAVGEKGSLTVTEKGGLTVNELVLNADNQFSNAGSVTVTGSLSAAGKRLTNTGTLTVDGAATGTIVNNGTLSVGGGSNITLSGAGALTTAGDVAVAMQDGASVGTLTVGDGTATFTTDTTVGKLAGTGSLNVQGKRLSLGGTEAACAVNITAGTLDLTGCAGALNVGELSLDTIVFDSDYVGTADTPLITATALGTGITLVQDTAGGLLSVGEYKLFGLTNGGTDNLDTVRLSGETISAYQAEGFAIELQPDGWLVVAEGNTRTWNTSGTTVTDALGHTVQNPDGTPLELALGGENVYKSLDGVTYVHADGDTTIDLTDASPDSATDPGRGLVVSNLSGDGGHTLSIEGDGDDRVTLATQQGFTPEQTANLSLSGLDATMEGDLSLKGLAMEKSSLDTNGNTLTVENLSGDVDSILSGTVIVTGSNSFLGKYGKDGSTVELEEGAKQTLNAANGLTVAGSAGTAKLLVEENSSITAIETTGTNVTFSNGGVNTLQLTETSTMTGGTLALEVSLKKVSDHLQGAEAYSATTKSALKLTGVTIEVTMTDTDKVSELSTSTTDSDIVLFRISDHADSTIDACTLTIHDRALLDKYFSDIRLVQGSINVVGTRRTNYYGDKFSGLSANGTVGVDFAGLALSYVDPQNSGKDGDLAKVLDALDSMAPGDSAAADELGAAFAGAGTAAMGVALAGDMDRQLRAIRNRTTTMGVSGDYVYDDMPAFNAWINAEGDYRTLDKDGTMAGYTLNSWGGTVGVDVDFTPHFTAGVAATAMYGDLKADSTETKAEGDMDTYYVSLFARYADKAWVHTFVASVGMSDLTMDRTVTCGGEGSYTTTGDTTGVSFGLMYETGYVIALDEEGTACLQPVANITYKHTSVDGYNESGSDAALEVDGQTLDSVTIGLGARFQAAVGETVYNRTSLLEMRALAKVEAGDRSSSAGVALPGVPGAAGTVESAEADAFGIELGAGITIPVGVDSGALFIDASAELRGSYSNVNGTVGYRLNF